MTTSYKVGKHCISCRTIQTESLVCPGCGKNDPLVVHAKNWTDEDWEALNA